MPVGLCVTRLRYAQIHGFFSQAGARRLSAVLLGASHPIPASENAVATTSLLVAWRQPGHLSHALRPAIQLSLTGHQSCRATGRRRDDNRRPGRSALGVTTRVVRGTLTCFAAHPPRRKALYLFRPERSYGLVGRRCPAGAARCAGRPAPVAMPQRLCELSKRVKRVAKQANGLGNRFRASLTA